MNLAETVINGEQMKHLWITIALSSLGLTACGGSGGDSSTDIAKSDDITNLANTAWIKECSPYNKLSSDDSNTTWNVITKLSIDDELKSTYRTEYFRPEDTLCETREFDSIDVSTFDIKSKVISDESIAAYGLNETFIYNSGDGVTSPMYTLIYVNSERLYFGQSSGDNTGETASTRHSSISLDNYFIQQVN